MRKLILSFLAVFTGLIINVTPARCQEDLSSAAREFFKSKGITLRNLKCTLSTDNLAVYNDSYAKCFVVLANSSLKDRLGGDQVLAYSTESALDGGSDAVVNGIISRLSGVLNWYGDMIQPFYYSRKDNLNGYVAPMALNIGPGEPYNKNLPVEDGKPLESGCGPVALAQLIYANKFPVSPQGDGSITDTRGKVSHYYMHNLTLKYNGSEGDIQRAISGTTASLDFKASEAGEQASLDDLKNVLVYKWSYRPNCTHITGGNSLDFAFALKNELLQRRPVIVAQSGVHTFICDGLDGAFVHLNFGWGGACNGWFRLLFANKDAQCPLFNEMLVGVAPLTDADRSTLHITTKTPGSLESLLTEEGIKNVYSLKVSGPINAADIKLLRNMAGASVEEREGCGILTELDLNDATIVGHEPYLTLRCDFYDIVESGTYPDGTSYNYVVSKIQPKEWAKFLRYNLQENSSRLITRDALTGIYYITYYVENNIIGDYMFKDCVNLKDVMLPVNLLELRSNVFMNCKALKGVDAVPDKYSPDAFKGSGYTY